MTKLRCALVFVSNMERSVAFYRDVLGWPLKCQSPERSEFAGQRTMIETAWRTPMAWGNGPAAQRHYTRLPPPSL
jgi:catechol 2,3-dioxygenase-like lactoylglutathione lyase family enzyme